MLCAKSNSCKALACQLPFVSLKGRPHQLSQKINEQLFKEQKHDYLSILRSLEKNKLESQLILKGKEIVQNFDNLSV